MQHQRRLDSRGSSKASKPFKSLGSVASLILATAVGLSCRAPRAGTASREDAQYKPAAEAAGIGLPELRVNQLGYLPRSTKVAVLVSARREPQPWQLTNAAGERLVSGRSLPFGFDETSGDAVHWIDFSSFVGEGQRFTLGVGSEQSDPFAIDAAVFGPLGRDVLRFFYHMRSGTPVEMPYAEGAEWTHPAGHQPDMATCGADVDCSYSLDVTGGWYDAGDQGKYVVNGGFSVWLLHNAYERTALLGRGGTLTGDGVANIPESGNGIPDLLDEARWEVEFLLAMQVPDGEPLAGMAHHKMHDADWTPLGTAPAEDQQPRVLRPPSTAATLNLAAAAAQAARLWPRFDRRFAERCRKAATSAFRAALRHPARFAKASDNRGGGAYPDGEVGDEFYWAAAELFLTTGEPEYLDHLTRSSFDGALANDLLLEGGASASAVTWDRVAALGKMSLALSGGGGAPQVATRGRLSPARRLGYQSQLRDAAERVLVTQERQGYRFPMRPAAHGHYPWGSNADVLGNMVLLGSAGDWGGDSRFAQGVTFGMDYLLGRNAMGQSYVTGFGTRPLLHPHHRFWAQQANAAYPSPPPGAISGGPNSRLEDPYVRAAGLRGCPLQKCFVDHIEAYSVNEVAINWNAALVWAVAWLGERAQP